MNPWQEMNEGGCLAAPFACKVSGTRLTGVFLTDLRMPVKSGSPVRDQRLLTAQSPVQCDDEHTLFLPVPLAW